MTDNNKYIPKLPETKAEIVLNQEQQNLQEKKPIVEKAVETVADTSSAIKETVLPTVHASDDKNKGKSSSSNGRGSPKIVQKDTHAEAMRHERFEREQAGQQNLRDAGCELQ